MSVFMCVTNCRLWPNGVFFFLNVNRVVRYGSKDSKSRRTSKLHDRFKSYNDFNDVFCP